MRASGLLLAGLMASPVMAQPPPREDNFVRPPHIQAPQAPGGTQPPLSAPGASVVSVDVLVKQGFEVKAVSKTSDKATDYLVMLQRSGELRTCLMRLSRDTTSRALKRDSVCF